MCIHRLFIHSVCGHSTFSPFPLITCRNACIPPDTTHSTTCTIIAHPYQSWKLESLCPSCEARRTALLEAVEITQVVKFDEWRWKVSYGMPAHGKDFWGRKAEEREEGEASLKGEGRKKRKRFSWRRSRRKTRGRDGEGGMSEGAASIKDEGSQR